MFLCVKKKNSNCKSKYHAKEFTEKQQRKKPKSQNQTPHTHYSSSMTNKRINETKQTKNKKNVVYLRASSGVDSPECPTSYNCTPLIPTRVELPRTQTLPGPSLFFFFWVVDKRKHRREKKKNKKTNNINNKSIEKMSSEISGREVQVPLCSSFHRREGKEGYLHFIGFWSKL
jgi:hypothetical protein